MNARNSQPSFHSHASFEERLDEACQRAANAGGALALARLQITDEAPGGPAADLIGVGLRAGDFLAQYAPGDYEVLWRAARFYFWASDDPGVSKEQRSRWGKDGWDIAERAIALNPNDVAGYYWGAFCMGNYALGLGVVKALSQGMEGKFRDRMTRAQTLNAGYDWGGVETAWGRFFDKLPWPKRDRKKAEEHLRKAIEINPYTLRARVFLASLYLDTDRIIEAKRLLDEVVAAVPGRYDAPEERRDQALAQGLMPTLLAKLK